MSSGLSNTVALWQNAVGRKCFSSIHSSGNVLKKNKVSLRIKGKRRCLDLTEMRRMHLSLTKRRGKEPGIFKEAIKMGWDPNYFILLISISFTLWM